MLLVRRARNQVEVVKAFEAVFVRPKHFLLNAHFYLASIGKKFAWHCKAVERQVSPWLLARFYLGSGLGLSVWFMIRRVQGLKHEKQG